MSQLTFQLKRPVTDILKQIQELTRQYDGDVQGDEKSGQVSMSSILGIIKGEYTIEGDQLHLKIISKPFLVGYETIRSTIKENIAGLA